jgi:L-threonylcarbamoyladenylate synthase
MVKQADTPATHFHTQTLPADDSGIAAALMLLADGLPVAIPTETVYGLAADATRGEAVARIYEAKGRPDFNPLIVHVPDVATARTLIDIPATADALIKAFWPGPLTLVAPARTNTHIASLVTAGLPTLAVRVPAHPLMQHILRTFGKPLAAPSANASGTLSPTRANHVLKSLSGRIPAVVDGGSCVAGLESTILGFSANDTVLLRPGAIPAEEIDTYLPQKLTPAAPGKISAPGQLLQHYAPSKPLRLNATSANADEILIGFGKVKSSLTLSNTGLLAEAAAQLFDVLHQADSLPIGKIAMAPIPETGLGIAINDRLRRAALLEMER